jgi:hypothetical protein
MMVYLAVAIKNPQDPQNHNEQDKHGSGEPAREHNNIILLATMFIMRFYRSTEYTQFTSLFFTLISFEPA